MNGNKLLEYTLKKLSEDTVNKPSNGDIVLAKIVYPYSSKFDTLAVGIYRDGAVLYYNENYLLAPLKVIETYGVLGHIKKQKHVEEDIAGFYNEKLGEFIKDYFDKHFPKLSLREINEEEVNDKLVVFAYFRGFLEFLVAEDPDDYDYPILAVSKSFI